MSNTLVIYLTGQISTIISVLYILTHMTVMIPVGVHLRVCGRRLLLDFNMYSAVFQLSQDLFVLVV